MTRFILMYMGVLPFLGCTIVLAETGIDMPFGLDAHQVIRTYTLVIGSFMAGVYWGQHLNLPTLHQKILIIISNIAALNFWFFYLFLSKSVFLVSAALLFLVILAIDLLMAQRQFIEKTYAGHRVVVTILVIASLVLSSFLISDSALPK
ncbi:MAG: DUF3429 domain-containing protein [Betaproteobacteria bacterium]|jgi:hypothetical protein